MKSLLLTILVILSTGLLPAQLDEVIRPKAEQGAALPVTELFRISKVGRPNCLESRKELVRLYGELKGEYDAKVKREAAGQQAYQGDRVRVIDVLKKKDANGSLYLCIYKGVPAILSFADTKMSRGQFTPPLTLVESGTYETTVVRTVKVPVQGGGGPALETVDSSANEATFFGIALPGAAPAPAETPKFKRKEVTETKTYPKFKAAVSTVPLPGGPAPLSQELFLSLVKNGEVFTVKEQQERKCQTCGGFRRITDTRLDGREPDGKMSCPACREAGKLLWDVTTKIVW